MKAAGVTGVIAKAGGSNNEDFPLYLETVHQENARTVFGTVGHYWANGQVGMPAQIAERIVASGLVKSGEPFAWDIETWPNEAREWTPAEVVERAKALAEIKGGIPLTDQIAYLSIGLLRKYDWRPLVDLGVRLWVAAWDDGPCLVRHWRKGGVWLRQITSSSNAAIRKVYDGNLDLNREPYDVWTVEELQTVLGVDADNDYGRITTNAVRDWQASHGLQVDGDAGPKTLATMTKPA